MTILGLRNRNVLLIATDSSKAGVLAASFKDAINVQITELIHKPDCDEHQDGQAHCGDLDKPELPFAEQSFDSILMDGILERLRDPLPLLRKTAIWLRPGGDISFTVPNARRIHSVRTLVHGHWRSALPVNQTPTFTLADIEQLCFRAGLAFSEVGMVPGSQHAAWHQQGRPNVLQTPGFTISGFSPDETEQFYSDAFNIRARAIPRPDYGLTSIIILSHNQLDYTRRCIESVLRYTDEPCELILIDNGSTDGTLAYLEQLRSTTANIQVISNPDNRGFPAAVNQGIRAASGKQILLLNNDTIVATGWLRRMLDVLQSDPHIGLVGPVSNNVSGPQQIPVDYDDFSLIDPFAWRWQKSHAGEIVDSRRLVGFCLLIRKEVIDKVGNLDEEFGIGCYEDDEFCHRAMEAGFRAVIARDSFIHHFGGMTFRNTNIDFAALMARNRVLFEQKVQLKQVPRDLPEMPRPKLRYFIGPRTSGGRLLERNDRLNSCCMIVRNNAKTIAECILSVLPWVDEIIVVDTGSTDGTDEICKKLGARVYYFPWCDDFSAARNESLKYARGRWIFWIDSDDVLPAESARQMRNMLEGLLPPNIYGFTMKVLCPGPGEDGQWNVTEVDHVKIFLNREEHRFEFRMHEQILGALQRNGGDTAFTPFSVVHKNHDYSPEGQKRKISRDLHLLHLEDRDRPDHPFTNFNMGMTYANKAGRPDLAETGDFDKAKHHLRRSIDTADPNDSHVAKAYSLWVSCHHRLGEAQQAWHLCNKALEFYPFDDELRQRKAMLCRDRKGPFLEDAIKILLEILLRPGPRRFSSGDHGIHGYGTRNMLAEIYEEMGQHHKAEEQWRLAVTEMPTFVPGWQGLADAVRKQQKWNQAEKLAHELMAMPRLHILGLFVLSDAMKGRGRLQEARAALERILQLQPGHPQALERLQALLAPLGHAAVGLDLNTRSRDR